MLGYDWPRVHGMLTALPVALLSLAVALELAAIVLKRERLHGTSLLILVLGAIGAGVTVLAGLEAEDHIDHGPAIHEIMEEHKELALITLGIFAVLLIWRLIRERRMGMAERYAALFLGFVGFGFLAATGHHGGELVFEHAAGVPNAMLRAELGNRAEGHHHHGEDAEGADHIHAAEGDSAHERGAPGTPAADSAALEPPGHEHPPGTPPHEH
ncbi:MAG TPA: DUF2231 domain-containing protein [Gemmatimonadales bacterium]|nr:DUF2231 domain-containing protein [Gemmatimonadales bacterium]